MTIRIVKFTFLLAALAANSAMALQEESGESDREERVKVICDACVEAIQESVRRSLDLHIDFYQRQLNLNDSQTLKARVLAKGVAAKHARLFEKPMTDSMSRLPQSLEGEYFSINGEVYSFDGEKQPDELPDVDVKLILQQQFRSGSLTIKVANRSSGTGFRVNEALKFVDSLNFRKALRGVNEDSLDDVIINQKNARRELVAEGLVALFSDKLNLSEEQLPQMRAWVDENLGVVNDQPVYTQLSQKFNKNNNGFFDDMPAFLTSKQKTGWHFLKNSHYPVGW